MDEKLMQDIIVKFPSEILGEEGLQYIKREIQTGNRRIDILLKDRMDRIILLEVQRGSLDTKHIDRHIDFVEGFIEHNPDTDIRLLFVANRVDPLRKQFLERRGYEYLEIPQSKFSEIARKYKLIAVEQISTPEPTKPEYDQPNNVFSIDSDKREKFVLYAKNKSAKYFWKRFFECSSYCYGT